MGIASTKMQLIRAAIEKNNIDELKTQLLDENLVVNETDDHHRTVLLYAVIHGRTSIVTFLIENYLDCDIHIKDAHGGYNALMKAARFNHLEIVKILLIGGEDGGADVCTTNDHGNTALHMSASKGYIDIVRLLIRERTADNEDLDREEIDLQFIDAQNKFGNTALMCASERNHKRVVEYLITKQADINVKDKTNGNTALHTACKQIDNVLFMDIVQMLIDHKELDLNQKNNAGHSAFMIAVENGSTAIIEMLKNAGAE